MKPLIKILFVGGVGFAFGYYLPKIKKSISKTLKEIKENTTEDDVEKLVEDIKDQCCDKVEKIEDAAKEVAEKVTADKEKK